MKYTVTFLLAKQKTDAAEGRLRCRVSFNKTRVEFNMGYFVNLAGWNSDTQRCRRNTLHGRHTAQKINADIDRADARINEIMEEAGDTITADMLRMLYRDRPEENKAPTVVGVMERFVEEERDRWSEATVKKFITLGNRIREYDGDIALKDVTTEWMSRYTRELCKGLNNHSVNKELKNMRWFMHWASSKGYEVQKEASEWAPKLKTTPRRVIFLEWHELMKVFGFDLITQHYREVRDCFCFCCFTGLRFSDVRALKRSDIHGDVMSVTTIKTGDLIEIPLNKYAKAILDRYKGDKRLGDRALPVCNNAEMNETLKEVMRTCEIDDEVHMIEYRGAKRIDTTFRKWEVMTTHCGRRTFVCNALQMGASAEVVMSITGHSSYSSMKPYIAVTSSAKKDAMKLFDEADTKTDTPSATTGIE